MKVPIVFALILALARPEVLVAAGAPDIPEAPRRFTAALRMPRLKAASSPPNPTFAAPKPPLKPLPPTSFPTPKPH